MFDPESHGPAGAAASAPANADPPATASEGRPGIPLEPTRVLSALSRARGAATTLSLAGLCLGAVVAKTAVPRTFTATGSVVWEPQTAARSDEQGAPDEPRTLRTLADSVKLPVNVERIREALHVRTPVEQLAARIEVDASTETRVITVHATGEDGASARDLASAALDRFISHRLELERSRLTESATLLATEASRARASLEDARQKLDAFRARHSVTDLSAERLAAVEQSSSLRTAADTARAESVGETARLRTVRTLARSERETAVLSESQARVAAQRLAETRADLLSNSARLSENNPRLQALRAQETALAPAVHDGITVGRVVGRNPQWDMLRQSEAATDAQRLSSARRSTELAKLADGARTRAIELTSIEGEESLLSSAVTVADAHLRRIEAARARAEDAARAPTSGLRVLTAPTAPARPTRSMRRVVVVGTGVLFGVLGLCVLALRALSGLRPKSAREWAFWTGVPALGAFEWSGVGGGVEACAEQLREFVGEGETLVVCAGEVERWASEQLCSALSSERLDSRHPRARRVQQWNDPGVPALRRAARAAARVLIVARSGAHTPLAANALCARLGRSEGVAVVVIGLGTNLEELPDRAGDPRGFVEGRAS